MLLPKYKLKVSILDYPIDTIVYYVADDGGYAQHETLETGKLNVAVTLDPEGEPPLFTVQASDLEYVGDF